MDILVNTHLWDPICFRILFNICCSILFYNPLKYYKFCFVKNKSSTNLNNTWQAVGNILIQNSALICSVLLQLLNFVKLSKTSATITLFLENNTLVFLSHFRVLLCTTCHIYSYLSADVIIKTCIISPSIYSQILFYTQG